MNDQLQFDDEEVSITLRRAWDRALRSLAARVNKPTFETHIRAIKPLGMADETIEGRTHCNVVLGVPSAFTREWVEKRHTVLIAQVLEEILDCDVRVRFALTPRDTEPASAAAAKPVPPPPPAPVPHQPSPSGGDLFGDADGLALPLVAASVGAMAVREENRETLVPAEAAPAPFFPPASTPPRIAPAPHPAAQMADANRTQKHPQSRANGGGASNASPAGSGASAGTTGAWEAASQAPTLNSRYTFDNFVVGQSNRLAQAGAQAVAQSPGNVYNPLFLYGPPGLGKTHLMHAIGNEIMKTQGGNPARVAFVSGESFTTHFISSLRTGKAEDFRRKWRSVDLWLVDDIQFIAGKESTKEEFFHTFNALYQTGKQIVISSDRSPRDLRTMDERLRSRFECGLIADIAPPDLETRLAILHKKADTEHARIPDEVLLYMAQLVQSNIRTLEGALVKLIAYASLVNSPVTTELATSVLERYYIASGMGDAHNRVEGGENSSSSDASPLAHMAASFAMNRNINGGIITPELVQKIVAKHFGVSEKDLSGKKRDKQTSEARQLAMHLIREFTELSLPSIAGIFGGRNHTTVMYSCEKVKEQLEYDETMKQVVDDLSTQLRAQASG